MTCDCWIKPEFHSYRNLQDHIRETEHMILVQGPVEVAALVTCLLHKNVTSILEPTEKQFKSQAPGRQTRTHAHRETMSPCHHVPLRSDPWRLSSGFHTQCVHTFAPAHTFEATTVPCCWSSSRSRRKEEHVIPWISSGGVLMNTVQPA